MFAQTNENPIAPVTLTKPAWVVVCRHGREFHLAQAACVKRQFELKAGADWDFICLTDRPTETWHLPLTTTWPGWWAILESFRLAGQPHVLTGLDTLLHGDISPILRLAETCPPSVLYGIRDLGRAEQWASGVTVWNGDWTFIPGAFDPAVHPKRFRGNQDFTAWLVARTPGRHLCYLQDKVDGIVSYKYFLRGRFSEPPPNTRVVCFHGKPRPWDVGTGEAPWVGAFLRAHSTVEQSASSPPALESMTTHIHDSKLEMHSVLWERDQDQVFTAMNHGAQRGWRLRARSAAGLLELRDPVSAADLAETLRGHGVDLDQPLDLEFMPNEPNLDTEHGENGRPCLSLPSPPQAASTVGGAAATMEGRECGAAPGSETLATTAVSERRLSRGGGGALGEEKCGVPPEVLLKQEAGAPPATGGGARAPGSAPLPTRLPPMFFRDDGGVVDLADLYQGQTLFLVLNGASLKDFDFDRLKQPGICSMGVNNGAHGFRPQFWTCVDDPTRFLDTIWRDPAILKFVPQPHFDKPVWDQEKDALSDRKVRDFPNVLGCRRNHRFQAAQWLHEDTLNWGNDGEHGGGRSVMLVALRLAYLLGFRKVHLLGCDFQMDEQNRYWFDEERSPASIRGNTNSYRILTGYFEQLKPRFDRAGFQVLNCNPQSQLKVFPFADLDTALDEARLRGAGSTRGMYVDRFKSPTLPKEEAREFLEPLLGAVNGAEVSTDPFVHLRLANLFPEATYRALLAHLPEDRHYHELRHADAVQPDGSSARLRFSFGDREMAALPPQQRAFWHRVLLALRDPALEKAFRDKLKAGLHERFRDSLSEITLRPVPELIRDLTGYRIGVHTDIFKKVITTQFYLPEDASQEPLGTTFYRKDSGGKADPVHRIPFLPATGYAFAVNARSWHGVDTVPAQPQPRNSLMLTYYLAKSAPPAP